MVAGEAQGEVCEVCSKAICLTHTRTRTHTRTLARALSLNPLPHLQAGRAEAHVILYHLPHLSPSPSSLSLSLNPLPHLQAGRAEPHIILQEQIKAPPPLAAPHRQRDVARLLAYPVPRFVRRAGVVMRGGVRQGVERQRLFFFRGGGLAVEEEEVLRLGVRRG